MAPQAGDECIVIFANDSWYRVIRSNDPNLEKIKHPRHDLNHGIALVGMALNPARPDRERTMREAPSPKEGVLEISNGESSLALSEQGEVSLKGSNLTITENGQMALKNGNEELLSLFDELLGVLELLTVTSRSEGLLPISPTQKAKVINIRSRFKSFLLNRVGSNENGQDNANDNETDNNGGGETVVDENDREESVFKLLLQTEVGNATIARWGCNLRVCQAIGEIVAHEMQGCGPLTAQQIIAINNKGLTALTTIWVNGQPTQGHPIGANCRVINPDWVIRETMRVLLNIPEEQANTISNVPKWRAGSINFNDYMNRRFVRHEHITRFSNNTTGTHFALSDRNNPDFHFDPDPTVTGGVAAEDRNKAFMFYG